jgi:serine/threonine-protein kinase
MVRSKRTLLGGALLALALMASSRAHAEATAEEKAAAEALFDAARALMEQGKYAEACAKFEESQNIDPGIGTLLYLGDCYEKSGRLASAWATFREGASRAQASGQADRARAGEERAKALAPRLANLVLNVAPENVAIEGFELRRAGLVVESSLFDVAVPVDPGDYEIRASAPGHETWTTQVRIDKEGSTTRIPVPVLVRSSAAVEGPTAPPTPIPTPPSPPPGPPVAEAPVDDGSTQRTIGLIIGGAGLVGVGIGAVFGLRAISKNDEAEELCSGSSCSDPEGVALTDEARDAATISNIAFGLGAAALVGGVALYFTAPSAEPQHAWRVAPLVGTRGGGVSLGGRF